MPVGALAVNEGRMGVLAVVGLKAAVGALSVNEARVGVGGVG